MPEDKKTTRDMVDFGAPETEKSIIKVIGVGGGGGNAVNHMYKEGIHDVSFLLCNTDCQTLNDSSIPQKLQLGDEGLGAGNIPEKGRKAALETKEEIKKALNDGTRMAFITAGMGGGTGTGAGPVIAQISKDMGILTVGIVTIPFKFEGTKKIDQALDGVEEMAKHVDALLVINNERLRQVYGELSVLTAFGKADDTLSVAAKSIAEIITVHGLMNLDFNDVRTVLQNGGVAIMSTGYGEGEGRVKKAIDDALNSPLLNDNDVFNSKKVLLNISFAGDNQNEGLMMDEMTDVNDFMAKFDDDYESKWGMSIDPELGKKVKVTILATGFGIENVDGMNAHLQVQKAQDLKAQNAQNEKESARAERRIHYYGSKDGSGFVKHMAHIFLFAPEDLSNADLIQAVDESPTYMRSSKELKELNTRLAPEAVASIHKPEPEAFKGGVISFS